MAGSEQVGLDGADPELFVGATWVLTPTATTDPDAYARLAGGGDVASGPRCWRCRPSSTTRWWRWCPTCPHLTAATLMNLADRTAEKHGALLRLAAGGFRDMTRIAAGQPGIWPDVCAENAAGHRGRLRHPRCADLTAMRDRVAAARPGRAARRALDHAADGPTIAAVAGRASRAADRAPGARARPPRGAGRDHHPGRRPGGQHLRPRDRPQRRRRSGRARAGGRRRRAPRLRDALTGRGYRSTSRHSNDSAPSTARATAGGRSAFTVEGGRPLRGRRPSPGTSRSRIGPCSWRRWPVGRRWSGGCPTVTTWPAPPTRCVRWAHLEVRDVAGTATTRP